MSYGDVLGTAPTSDLRIGGFVLEAIARFVDAVHSAHVPAAVGDLADERSVGLVLIEMLEPAALAEPEERAVLQPDRIAVLVDPRGRCFAKHTSRASIRGIYQIQVEPRLLAILDLVDDLL